MIPLPMDWAFDNILSVVACLNEKVCGPRQHSCHLLHGTQKADMVGKLRGKPAFFDWSAWPFGHDYSWI